MAGPLDGLFGPQSSMAGSTIGGTAPLLGGGQGTGTNMGFMGLGQGGAGDRGMGIADPQGSFIDYTTSPGVMPMMFDPYQRFGATGQDFGTVAPQGYDMLSPGVGEQAFQQSERSLAQPGEGEQYWNQIQGQFNGIPQGTQRAEEQYQRYVDKHGKGAGLDPYYEQQRKKGLEELTTQQAARGGFGSSRSLDQSSEMLSALGAEQANREADFDLQQLGLGGTLARNADLSSLGGSANELGWLQGLGSLAGQAQAEKTGRLGQWQNAANMSQQLQEGRGNQAMADQMAMAQLALPMFGNTYGAMIGGDQALMDSAMAAELGLADAALGQDYRGQQKIKDDAKDIMSMMTLGAGGMMGAG